MWITKRWFAETRDIPAHWLWLIISEQWLRETGHTPSTWFETSPPERLELVNLEEAISKFIEGPSGVLVIGEVTEEMKKFISFVTSLGYSVQL